MLGLVLASVMCSSKSQGYVVTYGDLLAKKYGDAQWSIQSDGKVMDIPLYVDAHTSDIDQIIDAAQWATGTNVYVNGPEQKVTIKKVDSYWKGASQLCVEALSQKDESNGHILVSEAEFSLLVADLQRCIGVDDWDAFYRSLRAVQNAIALTVHDLADVLPASWIAEVPNNGLVYHKEIEGTQALYSQVNSAVMDLSRKRQEVREMLSLFTGPERQLHGVGVEQCRQVQGLLGPLLSGGNSSVEVLYASLKKERAVSTVWIRGYDNVGASVLSEYITVENPVDGSLDSPFESEIVGSNVSISRDFSSALRFESGELLQLSSQAWAIFRDPFGLHRIEQFMSALKVEDKILVAWLSDSLQINLSRYLNEDSLSGAKWVSEAKGRVLGWHSSVESEWVAIRPNYPSQAERNLISAGAYKEILEAITGVNGFSLAVWVSLIRKYGDDALQNEQIRRSWAAFCRVSVSEESWLQIGVVKAFIDKLTKGLTFGEEAFTDIILPMNELVLGYVEPVQGQVYHKDDPVWNKGKVYLVRVFYENGGRTLARFNGEFWDARVPLSLESLETLQNNSETRSLFGVFQTDYVVFTLGGRRVLSATFKDSPVHGPVASEKVRELLEDRGQNMDQKMIYR